METGSTLSTLLILLSLLIAGGMIALVKARINTEKPAFAGFTRLLIVTPEMIAREGLREAVAAQMDDPGLSIYEVELYLFEREQADTVLPPQDYRQLREKGLLTGADECTEVTLYMAATTAKDAGEKALDYYTPLMCENMTAAVLTPPSLYTPDPEWLEYHCPACYGPNAEPVPRNKTKASRPDPDLPCLNIVGVETILTHDPRTGETLPSPLHRYESVWVRTPPNVNPFTHATAYLNAKYKDKLQDVRLMNIEVSRA